MATLVASLYGVLNLEDNLTPGLKKAHSALGGLTDALKVIGAGAFFAKVIHETSEAEGAMAQLDAVLRSTSGNLEKASTAGGKWATVTRQSGEHVKEWKTQLKNAEGAMERLSAKQSAGIPLTQAEHNAYAKASAAAAQYGNALNLATTSKKVWIDAEQAGIGVSHMARSELINMANAFSKTTKFSDEQVIRAEAMLLTFTKIGKNVFPDATEAVLDMSEAMGQDWKSSAIQIGKALNDPIQGITALRRVGVTFSNEQERMIKQLVKSGKLFEAQKMVLAELRTEFGGSAKAAGETLGGALAILGNQASNLLEAIGGALSPAIKVLGQVFGAVVDALIPLAPVLAIVTVALGAMELAASPIVAALLPILAPIALITGAVALLKSAWENDFLGIATAVTQAYNTIKPELDKIGAAFGNIMSIMNTGQAPGEVGPERFEPTEGKLGGGAGTAKAKKSDFGERLTKAIDEGWPQLEAAIGALGVKLGPALEKLWDTVGPNIDAGVKKVWGFISTALNTHVVEPLKADVGNMLAPIAKAFQPGGDLDTALAPLRKMLVDVFGEAGPVQGAIRGVIDKFNATIKVIQDLWAQAQGPLTQLGDFIGEAAKNIQSAIGPIVALFAKLLGTLLDLPAAAKAALNSLGGGGGSGGGGDGRPPTTGTAAESGQVGGGFPTKDTGGSLTADKIFGSNVPELFLPSSSGTAIPLSKLRLSGSSGGMTVINLNAYGVNDSAALVNKVNSDLKRRNRRTI